MILSSMFSIFRVMLKIVIFKNQGGAWVNSRMKEIGLFNNFTIRISLENIIAWQYRNL